MRVALSQFLGNGQIFRLGRLQRMMPDWLPATLRMPPPTRTFDSSTGGRLLLDRTNRWVQLVIRRVTVIRSRPIFGDMFHDGGIGRPATGVPTRRLIGIEFLQTDLQGRSEMLA